jgi:predicted DNA-binding protein
MRKPQTKPKRRKTPRTTKQKPAPDVHKAVERYTRENDDIVLALEAMRRAQIAQEGRMKYKLERFAFHSA